MRLRVVLYIGKELRMEKKKTLPFEATLAIVMMVIVGAIAANGIFMQKLPFEALRYPIFCFIVFFTTCGIEIIRGIRKRKAMGDEYVEKSVYHNRKNYFITVGMLIVYVVLMWLFGFIISSIALTIAFTWYYQIHKVVVVNVVAAAVIISIYFVFSNALYIFLPKGLLFRSLF